MLFFDSNPIIACSTGIEKSSAIALIRISGLLSLDKLQQFFSSNLLKISPRVATRTFLLDGEEKIDDIILTYFKAPRSYTGEDMIELAVHGNPISVKRIITLFVSKADFREAKPGEFTYRAFKNRKIEFKDIEGLDLFLNASTPYMLKQSFSLLHGDLFKEYEQLHHLFLKLKASVELSIDFLEDIGEEGADKEIKSSFSLFFSQVDSLNIRSRVESSSLTNPSLVLSGPPNAGKSTLFNLLLGEARAIVSPTPGTTRDYISETINIAGNSFKLIDTAGIRESFDQIEVEGINRTKRLSSSSFFRCFLLSAPEIIHALDFSDEINRSDLFLVTHSDQISSDSRLKILKDFPNAVLVSLISGSIEPEVFSDGSIEPPPISRGSMGPANSSAGSIEPTSNQIAALIFNKIDTKYVEITKQNPIVIDRHRTLINKIYIDTTELDSLLRSCRDIAIISSKINNIGTSLEELIGIITPDQLLASIFANFCIGK